MAEQPDMILYTDAEGQGNIGAALVETATGKMWYLQSTVPEELSSRLKSRRTQINLFELIALWCSIMTWRELLQGCSTACYVDNQAALNMAIKGSSPCMDAILFLHSLWLQLAMMNTGCTLHVRRQQAKSG